jgi:hypothetical protein
MLVVGTKSTGTCIYRALVSSARANNISGVDSHSTRNSAKFKKRPLIVSTIHDGGDVEMLALHDGYEMRSVEFSRVDAPRCKCVE